MLPEIDVLIPFHRIDRFLIEAIESVEASSGVVARPRLINDTPRGTDIPKEVRKHVVSSTAGGEGFAVAMNAGKSFIQSDFTAVLGSDDLMVSDRLYKQVQALEGSNSDLCVTQILKISNLGIPIASPTGYPSLSGLNSMWLLLGPVGADGTWLAGSDWWKEKIDFENNAGHDWNLALKIFRSTRIATIDEPLYLYRMHGTQTTRTPDFHHRLFESLEDSWNQEASYRDLPPLTAPRIHNVSLPWTMENKDTESLLAAIGWLRTFIDRATQVAPILPRGLRLLIARRTIYLRARAMYLGNLSAGELSLDLREASTMLADIMRYFFHHQEPSSRRRA